MRSATKERQSGGDERREPHLFSSARTVARGVPDGRPELLLQPDHTPINSNRVGTERQKVSSTTRKRQAFARLNQCLCFSPTTRVAVGISIDSRRD